VYTAHLNARKIDQSIIPFCERIGKTLGKFVGIFLSYLWNKIEIYLLKPAMSQLNLSAARKIISLVKPSDLVDDTKRFHLILELKLIAKFYKDDESIQYTVDYLLNDVIQPYEKVIPVAKTKVNLASHYEEDEISLINKTFGLKPNNNVLTEQMLDYGYAQNEHIEGAKELYSKLKYTHFKPSGFITSDNFLKVVNKGDELIYALKQPN
jgi:hypothetical protein